jgi:hypothetical protein
MFKSYLESLQQLPIFEYLNKKNISYFDNFVLSLSYAKISVKAGYFFIVDAFFPGTYQNKGCTTIKILNTMINKD